MFEAKSRMFFFVYFLTLVWFTFNGKGRNQIPLRKNSRLLHKIYSSSESSEGIAPVLGFQNFKYTFGAVGPQPVEAAAEQGYQGLQCIYCEWNSGPVIPWQINSLYMRQDPHQTAFKMHILLLNTLTDSKTGIFFFFFVKKPHNKTTCLNLTKILLSAVYS